LTRSASVISPRSPEQGMPDRRPHTADPAASGF
jgi:hypothetical protein